MSPFGAHRPGLDQEILAFILRADSPPTIREIGRAVNAVPSIVHYHLGALERRGLITWERIVARGIRPAYRYYRASPGQVAALRAPGVPLGADATYYDARTGHIVFTFNREEIE